MNQRELELLIQKHNQLYYAGHPEISDSEFDSLLLQLKSIAPDSIILNQIGDCVVGDYEKFTRAIPMQSIDNVFNGVDLNHWAIGKSKFITMPKLDGMSVEIYYIDGKFDKAITRGDGSTGDVITHSVKTCTNLPMVIPNTYTITIRGECLIPLTEFAKLDGFANARNCVAGSLRQKDSRVSAKRHIQFHAYMIVDSKFDTIGESLDFLSSIGFTCVKYRLSSADELVCDVSDLKLLRTHLGYEVDGVVIGLNKYKDHIFKPGKYASHLIAYKWKAPTGYTIVKDITLQKGRTGSIVPVAELEPVSIGGTTVRRASLYNFDEIKRLGLDVGSEVIVERAGEVIPKVIKVIEPIQTYAPPECCPDCMQQLDKSQVVWKCNNPDCNPQKQIEYFASKGCADIQGLGPELIRQLVNNGLIDEFTDLFKFNNPRFRYQVNWVHGWSSNRIEDIRSKLENLRLSPARFYKCLGIPTVGEVKAKLLGEMYPNPADFIDDSTAGTLFNHIHAMLGHVSTYNVITWVKNHRHIVEALFQNVELVLPAVTVEPKTFVFTGKISKPRSEYEELVNNSGHSFGKSITKTTDYLVCADPDSNSSKIVKARKYGITIISEQEFTDLI